MKFNKAETTAHSSPDTLANEKHPLHEGEQRCICNRLLCIIKEGNVVEIKCPKCKRVMEIFTKGIDRIVCK